MLSSICEAELKKMLKERMRERKKNSKGKKEEKINQHTYSMIYQTLHWVLGHCNLSLGDEKSKGEEVQAIGSKPVH